MENTGLSPHDVKTLTAVWLRGMLEDFALYRREAAGQAAREQAAGYPLLKLVLVLDFRGNSKSTSNRFADLVA